jgi:hypothetical protein
MTKEDRAVSKAAGNKAAVERTFRITVHQPLSFMLEEQNVFQLNVGKQACRFFISPNHDDASKQRLLGGTTIHAEFSLAKVADLIQGLSAGLQLVEDFLTGLSVVADIPFEASRPVQIVDTTYPKKSRFVLFVDSEHKHWPTVVTPGNVMSVSGVIAHWDGLPKGYRIRRAARLYRQALGNPDEIGAFQAAYMGLESLEPVLAEMLNVPNGVEVVPGKCTNCGFKYTRNRTVLNAVRAYILGKAHDQPATPERDKEWKGLNSTRQDVFHSLKDLVEVKKAASEILPAMMHHLHDAICCLTHHHELEQQEYRLPRPAPLLALMGGCPIEAMPTLDKWSVLCQVKVSKWENYEEYGYVPQCELQIKDYHPESVAAVMIPLLTDKSSEAELIFLRLSEAK